MAYKAYLDGEVPGLVINELISPWSMDDLYNVVKESQSLNAGAFIVILNSSGLPSNALSGAKSAFKFVKPKRTYIVGAGSYVSTMINVIKKVYPDFSVFILVESFEEGKKLAQEYLSASTA